MWECLIASVSLSLETRLGPVAAVLSLHAYQAAIRHRVVPPDTGNSSVAFIPDFDVGNFHHQLYIETPTVLASSLLANRTSSSPPDPDAWCGLGYRRTEHTAGTLTVSGVHFSFQLHVVFTRGWLVIDSSSAIVLIFFSALG